MDKKTLLTLFFFFSLGLGAAGLLFGLLSIFGDSDWTHKAGLYCATLGSLFYLIPRLIERIKDSGKK